MQDIYPRAWGIFLLRISYLVHALSKMASTTCVESRDKPGEEKEPRHLEQPIVPTGASAGGGGRRQALSVVYNNDELDSFAGPAAMSSPAPNAAYNLTVAEVKASERPADYEALEPVEEPGKATFSKGKGAAKKRARDDGGDRDGEDDDDDDEEMDIDVIDVFV